MSAQPNQPYDDKPGRRRPFSTLLSGLAPGSDEEREAASPDGASADGSGVKDDSGVDDDSGVKDDSGVDDKVAGGKSAAPESGVVDSEVVTGTPVPPAPRPSGEAMPGFRRASTEVEGTRAFPRHAALAEAPGSPAASATPSASAPVADEPLLSDAADFRTRWQQTQAGFVDDPRQAVGEAAALIEQTAQALVVAVRQRQQQLRESWDKPTEAQAADTEQLRLMMQRYRALFNQLCRP